MGKKAELVAQIKSIICDKKKLEKFLKDHSNLPSPRANLELMDAFADVNEDLSLALKWIEISEEEAGVNDPKSFLSYCAAVSLGQLYINTSNADLIPLLKRLSNDGRWRMRESVAFGFQRIGEHDFTVLQNICAAWIPQANNLEKRCILVSLAHPPFLNEKNAEFCLNIANTILEQLEDENPADNDFQILIKGLNFSLSVYVAASTTIGLQFLESWIGRNDVIDKIIRINLLKKRLMKQDLKQVEKLMSQLSR